MADNNIKWTDITKDPNWTGGINPNGMYTNTATRTPILCKDGTTDFSLSSSNAKYDNTKVCANNGGRAENQPLAVKPTSESVKQLNLLVGSNTLTAEDKFYEMLGIKKTSGGWGIQSRPLGRLLVAVVLVAGYFAYKKFKK